MKCVECDNEIPTERIRRRRQTKTCSDSCSQKRRRKSGRGIRLESSLANCLQCSKPISDSRRRKGARYCNQWCRRAFYRSGQKAWEPNPNSDPTTVGAAGELRVAADLLMRGYQVYRAIHFGAPCDLVTFKDGRFLRVEVKSKMDKKELAKNWPRSRSPKNYDVLAIIYRDGQIDYYPNLAPGVTGV